MGSNIPLTPTPLDPPFPPASLPDAASPDLVLAHPTPAERKRTWHFTYHMWGFALAEHDYLAREAYLTTVPLARDGGITHWILTVASLPPGKRPILSSCESLRKRAVFAAPTGPPSSFSGDGGGRAGEENGVESDGMAVVDGVAHGVASVFTEPAYRGRGYASRMMREVGERLRTWQAERPGSSSSSLTSSSSSSSSPSLSLSARKTLEGRALFSVLYSDIGKTFYARHGWAAFESSHVAFKPVAAPAGAGEAGWVAKAIGYHELAELCAVDERLLRAELARREAGGRTRAALLPELDALLWHLMREDFMTKHIFGKTPTVRGAVAGEPGRRVWAVWMRGYYGGLKKMEGNTLHVLRVVVEDPEQPDEELVDGFRSIVQMAQHEAAEWRTQDVQMWNPTPKIKGLVEKCGVEFDFVNRDKDSIASLMWYGEEPTAEVDWVANEKFAWC